jgi:hypothetical protein
VRNVNYVGAWREVFERSQQKIKPKPLQVLPNNGTEEYDGGENEMPQFNNRIGDKRVVVGFGVTKMNPKI